MSIPLPRPTILTVAGSDSSGGAGLQADLKAIDAAGGFAASVVTAVTAQNSMTVRGCRLLDPRIVREQLDAVLEDLPVAGVKSGMLGSGPIVDALADALERRAALPYVLDPVLRTSTGFPLLDEAGRTVLLTRLVPRAFVVTPNAPEARELTGIEVEGEAAAVEAARALLRRGARAVVIKGGHLGGDVASDWLVTGSSVSRFDAPRVGADNGHGTGCVFAATLATELALGRGLVEAVRRSKSAVLAALRHGFRQGRGAGPVDPLHRLHRRREGEEAG